MNKLNWLMSQLILLISRLIWLMCRLFWCIGWLIWLMSAHEIMSAHMRANELMKELTKYVDA
jgi:hypothetical protein